MIPNFEASLVALIIHLCAFELGVHWRKSGSEPDVVRIFALALESEASVSEEAHRCG